MPIDASLPFRAGTAANFSLGDILRQGEESDMRAQQLQLQQQQAARQQEEYSRKQVANSSLADLIKNRRPDGSIDTKSPQFATYADSDASGAYEMLGKLNKEQREHVESGLKDMHAAVQWAQNPQDWERVKQHYAQFAPEIASIPFEHREQALIKIGQLGEYLKAQEAHNKPINMAPGNELVTATGSILHQTPFAPRTVTVGEGQKVVEYNPNGGGQGGGDMSVEGLRPHFIAQESGGNYAAVNKDTGAMGAYQVMPETGKSLAQQLGLPWRPDLMTATSPEARQYQDTIGGAAIKEAVDAGQGSLDTTAMYYHGGSNRAGWGPKTHQYAEDMRGRVGGQGGGRIIAEGNPKQPKGQWHRLSPEEVQQAGLPSGVYQQSPDGEIKPVAGTTGKNAQQDTEAYSQSAMDAFDRAISSANRLLKHPGFTTGVGLPSINPLDGNLAGFIVPGSNAADFRAELDALKAQVFLPMVQSMKGMGALSNSEGEKLTASIGALNPSMSEGGFKASLNRVIADLNRYKARARKPAAPSGGGGNVIRYDARGNRIP